MPKKKPIYIGVVEAAAIKGFDASHIRRLIASGVVKCADNVHSSRPMIDIDEPTFKNLKRKRKQKVKKRVAKKVVKNA